MSTDLRRLVADRCPSAHPPELLRHDKWGQGRSEVITQAEVGLAEKKGHG